MRLLERDGQQGRGRQIALQRSPLPRPTVGCYKSLSANLTAAATAPSKSGNVQIKAVTIRRSDKTCQACPRRELKRTSPLSQHSLNALRQRLDWRPPISHQHDRGNDSQRSKEEQSRKGEVSDERHHGQRTHPSGRNRGFHVYGSHHPTLSGSCGSGCSELNTLPR